ncbi:ABC1 family protein [Dissophora ornata]|nr:hypothetical protein BGZ58_000964 [Dissophora ornata]KAI8597388.1 ABC1 family protein [Dissophora ornata]
MSARRFADVQALAAAGAGVSRKFLALEMRQLKAYAATSSLLKTSSPVAAGNTTTTAAATATATEAAATPQHGHSEVQQKPQQQKQQTPHVQNATTAPFKTITTGTWLDQLFTSASNLSLKATTSPSLPATAGTPTQQSSTTAAEEPSLLDPTFLATPAAHGHRRPTITTIMPPRPSSSASVTASAEHAQKKEEKANRDALETLLRESKWLDSLPAEDITKLNKGAAEYEELWAQRERLGPRMYVYEPLVDSAVEDVYEEDDQDFLSPEITTTTVTSSEPASTAEASYQTSAPTIASSPPASSPPMSAAPGTPESTFAPVSPSIPTSSSTAIPDQAAVPPVENLFSEEGNSRSEPVKKNLTAASMPTSRISRLFHYGGLAASLGVGAISETVRRSVGRGTTSSESPMFLTPANMDRLVNKLTQMRGAALKVGQMLSIQDNKMLPPELEEVLLRVQNSANFMPEKQMRKVMSQTMGSNWESEFTDFGMIPIAAASIGQVHKAIHRATGMPVAVKVQYPGVAASIDSDLSNLKTLVIMSSILPRGMYLDNTIKVAQRELGWETDYLREAECIEEFGRLLKDDPDYQVPRLVKEASGPMVLTMEWMQGETMTDVMQIRDQAARDRIGTNILGLCLRELFEFQYMQTDPNWSNFLYNPASTKLELLDFGATRGFDSRFTTLYLKTILAGAAGDREACLHYSRELGFLTGEETEMMETAHINSLLTLSEPFQDSAPDVYDFKYQTITQRVKDEIPTMLKHRLTPPPDETYSMHRKMAGAFLLCSKLGARVESKKLFKEMTGRYKEDRVEERRGVNYGRGA